MQIIPLQPLHAPDTARLHIAGQPGAFLTSLGPAVLAVFYSSLPRSPYGYGFTATEREQILGFVSATTSVGQLFVELGTRRIGRFLPPLLARFARQPKLMLRSIETLFYPMVAARQDAREGSHHIDDTCSTAELLSIMVEPDARGKGVGTLLMDALVAESRRRHIGALDVTVDQTNVGARRFYERNGFVYGRDFTLYGRPMCQYRLELKEHERRDSAG